MTSPVTAMGDLVAQLAAITCPVERAVQITRLAERNGNLPPDLAEMRRQALQEARDSGTPVRDLAKRLKRSRVIVYTLTITRKPRPASESSAR